MSEKDARLEELGKLKDLWADHPRWRGIERPYTPEDVMLACEIASARDAVPVTTEKDFVRLPEEAREMVRVAPVALAFERPEEIKRLLKGLFR